MATIVIDFDGTIVEHEFPRIGPLKPNVIAALRQLKADGHYLVLWTCREDHPFLSDQSYLSDAVNFMKSHGIEFDAINKSLPLEKEGDWRKHTLRRKPHGHIYIDDCNLGGLPIDDWDEIYHMINRQLNVIE